MNFILPIELAGPGPLAQIDLHSAGGDRLPVDRHRIEDMRIGPEMVDEVVAPLGEIGAPLLEDGRRKLARGDVGRRVPVGVERDVADEGVHHRRLGDRVGTAGDDAHRVHHLPVLVHVEPRGGRIDDHVAAPAGGQRAGALEIELQQPELGGAAVNAAGDRLPQLGVDRVHPAHLLDVVAERRRVRRGVEQLERRWRRRLQLLVDIDDADAGVVPKVAGIGDEGAAQHAPRRAGPLPDCRCARRPPRARSPRTS